MYVYFIHKNEREKRLKRKSQSQDQTESSDSLTKLCTTRVCTRISMSITFIYVCIFLFYFILFFARFLFFFFRLYSTLLHPLISSGIRNLHSSTGAYIFYFSLRSLALAAPLHHPTYPGELPSTILLLCSFSISFYFSFALCILSLLLFLISYGLDSACHFEDARGG